MKQPITTLVVGGVLALALFGEATAGPLEDGQAALQRNDYATALLIFRPLAEQGDAGAQFNLGSMYEQGQGVPQDDEQAAAWLRKAAGQGSADAQLYLGGMYEQGQGVPQDYAQAYMWLSLAAANVDWARTKRDSLAAKISPEQITEAERLAREWMRNHASTR